MSNEQKIAKFFNIMASEKDFAYDVETTGLSWQKDRIVGYSVSDGVEGLYIPVRHTGGGNINDPQQFERQVALAIKKHPKKIIGHNLKFDAHFSENEGIELQQHQIEDTMTRAALINENKRSYSLEACCKDHPEIPQKIGQQLYEHIAQAAGCSPTRDSMGYFHILPGDDLLANEYAAGDTLSAFCLRDKQKIEIYGQNLDVVENMEQEITFVLL